MSDNLNAINTVLLGVNLVVIFAGIIFTLKHFRLTRTWSYIERYNSSDMVQPKIAVTKLLKDLDGLDDTQITEALDKLDESDDSSDIEFRIHIDTFINLFTELGVAYRAKALDKRAFRALDSLVPRYWKKLSPIIIHNRKKAHPYKIHESFEYLAKEISNMKLS